MLKMSSGVVSASPLRACQGRYSQCCKDYNLVLTTERCSLLQIAARYTLPSR